MAYRVEITDRALGDVGSAVGYIAQYSAVAATRWFDGLMAAVASLADWPGRCALAPEAETVGRELRQLLYGKGRGIYRILFLIHDEGPSGPQVRIIAIRHGARRSLEPEDLSWLDETE